MAAKKKSRIEPVYYAAGIASGIVLAAGALAALFLVRRPSRNPAEHAAPDLAADAPTPGAGRAPDAFRPDPTAPVPPELRESLRPATGPAPSLVEDRGSMNAQTAPGTWPRDVQVAREADL